MSATCKNSDGKNCQVVSDAAIGSRRIRIFKETVGQPQQCERRKIHIWVLKEMLQEIMEDTRNIFPVQRWQQAG